VFLGDKGKATLNSYEQSAKEAGSFSEVEKEWLVSWRKTLESGQ
jgi:hypothetical protein